jgi:hypothetical protein
LFSSSGRIFQELTGYFWRNRFIPHLTHVHRLTYTSDVTLERILPSLEYNTFTSFCEELAKFILRYVSFGVCQYPFVAYISIKMCSLIKSICWVVFTLWVVPKGRIIRLLLRSRISEILSSNAGWFVLPFTLLQRLFWLKIFEFFLGSSRKPLV